ncbi:MAG: hypothetical protein ACXVZN_00510 [Gaiellaceae bacterium]
MAATYGLHALIDEARRRASRRRWLSAGVLALLVGAGIWGGLALTSGSRATPTPPAPPGYHLVRARGTVEHVLVRGSFRSQEGVHASRNVSKAHLQVWFDRKTGLMRVGGCWANFCSAPKAARCTPACQTADSFGMLFYRYWPVDTTRFVRRPGLGTFHGREVIWIGKIQEFPPSYRDGEWIALDPRTHDAVAWRLYGTTTKPAGPILTEFWVARRFPDIAPKRFWFALRNRSLVSQFVRLQPLALEVPGGGFPRALPAAPQVVGRIDGASIFAVPTRNGFWRMFSVDAHGKVGGGPSRVHAPHAIGVVQVGRGSLFSSRAYLVVVGDVLERSGAKLFLVHTDGSRERIKPILVEKPAGAGFYYYVIPKAHRAPGPGRALEVVRGSRLVARRAFPLPYQRPEQPGVAQLRGAQRVLSHRARANHG